MKTLVSLCALFFTFPLAALAQETTVLTDPKDPNLQFHRTDPNNQFPDNNQFPRTEGYLLVAPGVGKSVFSGNGISTLHIAAGVERFIYKGLSIGAEFGPVTRWSVPQGGYSFSSSFPLTGLGSANLYYHFRTGAGRQLEPFITAGYSAFIGVGGASGYNAGVGTNVWLKKHVGLRFDVRYHNSWGMKNMGGGMGFTFR
jgi:hypothetical protein